MSKYRAIYMINSTETIHVQFGDIRSTLAHASLDVDEKLKKLRALLPKAEVAISSNCNWHLYHGDVLVAIIGITRVTSDLHEIKKELGPLWQTFEAEFK